MCARNKHLCFSRWGRAFIPCLIGMILLVSSAAGSPDINTVKIEVTNTSDIKESTPTLGADDVSRIVVYTSQEYDAVNDVLGPCVIYSERLTDDATIGPLMLVAGGSTDNQLNDISGSLIVYTAFTDTAAKQGQILLMDLDDGGYPYIISDQAMVGEGRIHGSNVVWIEYYNGNPRVMLKDVSTASAPFLISNADTQPASNLQIGDTLVVWEVGNGMDSSDTDIVAFDLRTNGAYIWVADSAVREQHPSTSGTWVTWEESISENESRILAVDVDGVEGPIVVVDNGGLNRLPTIDGDLIAYDTLVDDGSGNAHYDVNLYRISTGETYPIATGPGDQSLSNVFGNQVAYVENGDGFYDIDVVTFWFDPPVANAGPDQAVHAGTTVTLDGSASYDPDMGALVYAWELTEKPTGSEAILNEQSSVSPTFFADEIGDYTIRLTVTDEESLASEDYVTVSASNLAPIADAGDDQAVIEINTQVQLDGSQSWDPDGDGITYTWNMVTPTGSTATLSDPSLVNPVFIADVYGTYEITLVVSDPWVSSTPDSMEVSFANIAPVADAGQNQAVSVGDLVSLDGSASYDANNDPLSYSWEFTSKPPESFAQIFPANAVQPSFVADVAGTYIVGLVVNDGFFNSEVSYVTIEVTATYNELVKILLSAIDEINDLDPGAFKNSNMQNALTNKLNATLEMVDQGLYQEALDKLENDVLQKMNGCADFVVPDRNDWIRSCPEQNLIYPIIMEAIEILRTLV